MADDEPDVSLVAAADVTDLLDRIPGAFEQAQLGLVQARTGETVALDDL
ncbi:MAG: hypothetical protein H0V45_10580 [Actinobacteria bacterium]|nr:hypothetical protein [Actinomycetota bacterium]